MTAIERTILRARLPIRYTQGFNPHPILSLPCPRPTGVASKDDLLVMDLNEPDEAIEPDSMLETLNQAGPQGLRCTAARILPQRIAPQPEQIEYRLPLDQRQMQTVRDHLETLDTQPEWTVQRRKKTKRRSRSEEATRPVDLRPLIGSIRLQDDTLVLDLLSDRQRWAKPAEILGLLGLDAQTDLARLVRTRTTFDFTP